MSGIDLTTGFPVSNITASATLWLGIFAPYLELLAGVLLAFLVITYLITAIKNYKEKIKEL